MDASREVTMFGETEKEMRDAAAHNLGDPVLLNSYAAGILSDAQEILRRGNTVVAHQFMNKAKYFIAESTRLQREKEKFRDSAPEMLAALKAIRDDMRAWLPEGQSAIFELACEAISKAEEKL